MDIYLAVWFLIFKDISGFGLYTTGKTVEIIRISNTAMHDKKTNIHCHPNCEVIIPPIVGASSGEAPITRIIREKILALSSGVKKSRTIVIAATVATDAPRA